MGRIVINKTENGQTVILNDTAQEVNGGYFDSEEQWHEFGGGGGEQRIKNPIVHLALSSISTDIGPQGVGGLLLKNGILQEPDNPYNLSETPISLDLLAMYNDGRFEAYVASTSYRYEIVTTSDLVNCTVEEKDGQYTVIVTDHTKDASLSVVYSGNAD